MRNAIRLLGGLLLCAFSVGAQQLGGKAVAGGKAVIGGGVGAANTFTLVQQTPVTACSGSTTCNVTVTSTGTNHLMVATSGDGVDSQFISAISGAGTWICPASLQFHFNGSVSGCYNLSSTSGTTSLTLTLSDTSTERVVIWEYSFTQASCALDVIGTNNTSVSGGLYPGVALTLTGTNDVIIQWTINVNSSPTAISSPYGNFLVTAASIAYADSENTASGAAPNWSATTGSNMAVIAVSFK